MSLAPSSEMAGGLGSPPIQQLIDRGIRPGLGVDDERLTPGRHVRPDAGDDLVAARHVFDLKLAGKAGVPHLMSTRDVIRYATVDGARVAGLGAVTGSLEPGKQADVIVLRTDRPNIFPVNDPIGAVVWGMDTSNVDWVFVGGRVADARRRPRGGRAARPEPGDGGPASGWPPPPGSPSAPRREVTDERRPRTPSSALTSFVVASRYLPVYLAIAPARRRGLDLGPGDAQRAGPAAPSRRSAALLAITALGQMLVIMTGGIDLSVPGTLTLGGDDHGRGRRSSPTIASGSRSSPRSPLARADRVGQRDPDRRAQAQRADRHPRRRPDRDRDRQSATARTFPSRARCPTGCPTGRRPASSASARIFWVGRGRHARPHRRASVHLARSPVPGRRRQPGGVADRRSAGEPEPDPRPMWWRRSSTRSPGIAAGGVAAHRRASTSARPTSSARSPPSSSAARR